MLLLVAFPALLASLALQADFCTNSNTEYPYEPRIHLSRRDVVYASRGKPRHERQRQDIPPRIHHRPGQGDLLQDRAAVDVDLRQVQSETRSVHNYASLQATHQPLQQLFAGYPKSRRSSPRYLSRAGRELGVFGVAGSGWERQKGAKSTGAPSGHQLDTRACQGVPGSASQRSLNRQPDALGRSKRFRQRGNRGAIVQRALRPNLPFHPRPPARARARIASLQLAHSTATPAYVWLLVHADCSPRQSGTVDNLVRVSSLGSSVVVVGPANLPDKQWMHPVLEAGIKLQKNPRMPNALARTDDALEKERAIER
ncbi:hypothetical protein BDP55DRAFT_634822 [Colletotrichum godetiae]|uniref:Uncharacterized protein n=1 Tax=Colletotrichum godetiae TaxID=1209918 RepID=A0AAJ0AHQ2_9PEZI|nr:uncharacterized protein BDP55DRAFT_634822 [Colletotrichum godetiae]KAK1672557.1 hypothetical protein BDP55DRAFT_634822 [Colletotrichum godetiae]